MTKEFVYETKEETWDQLVTRLSALSVSSTEYAHWGLADGTNISQLLRDINSEKMAIISDNGGVDSFNESGNYTRTFPSQEASDSANAAIDAYDASKSANVFITTANGNVLVVSTTFENYLENLKGNANVSLST